MLMPRLRADRSASDRVTDSDTVTPSTPPRRIFVTRLYSSRKIVTLVFIATVGLLCLSYSRESNLQSASRKRVQSERNSLRVSLRAKIRRGIAPTASKNATLLEICDTHFGQKWLQTWDAAGEDLCSPRGGRGDDVQSTLRCRVMTDTHMTQASAPHVLCDARNLLVDPSFTRGAACPKHRPGYMCQGTSYHHYSEGAFGGACDWPARSLELFPKDHLRDIMESFATYSSGGLPEVAAEDEVPTLFVTREVAETGNVFHVLTDLLNAYITLRMLGWEDINRQVVLLDDHGDQVLDGFWAAAVAGGGDHSLESPWNATAAGGRQRLVRRLGEVAAPTRFGRAAFVPPGYSSLLFAHLYEDSSCPLPTSLFSGFRDFLLRPLGLHATRAVHGNAPLQVTFISRRPTPQRQMTRLIDNEADVVAMLRALPEVNLREVDLAALSLRQQLETMSSTDILIGMHGAAMAWTLIMPSHAAVVELWPKADGMWRCYEHTSQWAGLLYRRWANADLSKVSTREGSDYTHVDVTALRLVVEPLVTEVKTRRP